MRTIRPAAETSRSARGRTKLFGTTSPRTMTSGVTSASIRRQKAMRRTIPKLFLFLFPRQCGAHADLDDPQPLHPLDGEGDAIPRGLLPGGRHPPELVEQEPGDRVEFQIRDFGPERLVEMANRRPPEDEGGTVGALHDLPLFPVALLPDLPE